MIAKVYYVVGAVQSSVILGTTVSCGWAFPTRIFDRDELPQAQREYERLAKKNFYGEGGYYEAYIISMLGDKREIVAGNAALIEPWL